jgi:crotonobetainyl-CoA:carnitine CoA-transferase CaiB-like acyl-CoA transferase
MVYDSACVDVSLMDTALYLQSAPLAEFSATGVTIDQVSYWERYATVGLYESGGGPVYVAGYWNKDWQAICDIIGRPELIDDPRYADPKSRGARAGEVREIISAGFRDRPREELLAALEDHGVMAGAVRTYGEVIDSPQARANDSFSAEAGESGSRTLFPNPAYRLTPTSIPKPGRRLRQVIPPSSCCVRSASAAASLTSSSSLASSLLRRPLNT